DDRGRVPLAVPPRESRGRARRARGAAWRDPLGRRAGGGPDGVVPADARPRRGEQGGSGAMTRRRNTPPEWPDPPDFEGAREVTESLRRELVDIRRDVESIVREEVGKTPADPRRLEMMVRDAVQREVRRQFDERTPWLLTQLHWLAPTAGLLLGLSIGLSAYSALA